GAALAVDVSDVVFGVGIDEGAAALLKVVFQQLQVAAVGVQRVLRQPALRREVQQKLTQQRAAAARVERTARTARTARGAKFARRSYWHSIAAPAARSAIGRTPDRTDIGQSRTVAPAAGDRA